LPTFEAPVPQPPLRDPAEALSRLQVGTRLGDFELVRELGSGSFGRVYLAHQRSLDRMVALKVTVQPSSEARALAALEHEHIVRIFGEEVEGQTGLHLLAMQYVPGATLARVHEAIGRDASPAWTGRDFLDTVAACTPQPAPADPDAVRDAKRLARCDHIEAVCWLGARLAEALDHAHRQGILHRDVKPSNILISSNGRVLLTDFNLAVNVGRGEERLFGGTLSYMAPEHLEAFNPDGSTCRESVDARSDVYSLGVVLFELLTGKRPFAGTAERGADVARLEALTAERSQGAPSPRRERPDLPAVLDRVVRRCLDPNPLRRYQRAGELADVLDGCRQLRRWERNFPAPLAVTRVAHAAPICMFVFLALLPHLLGSLVNIAYNMVAIVQDLTPPQQETFLFVLVGYNAVVYPLCVWLLCRVMVPVTRAWKCFAAGEPLEAAEAARQRRRALQAPVLTVLLSCLGWLPGGVIFPLAIHLLAGPVRAEVFGHFAVSFTISGLIATTYSYFGMQMFVLRILYPRLWVDPRRPQQQARQELGPIESRLRLFQFTAGLIPLSGAMLLLLSVGFEGPMPLLFRALVVGLIALGMVSFGGALLASSRASSTLSVMLGSESR
jgi:serine/threonine protein kinase